MFERTIKSISTATIVCHHTLQEVTQYGRSSSLLGSAARLLIVEDRQHLCHRRCRAVEQCIQACMHHSQVIESATRDELTVQPYKLGLLCVIEREVKVKDIAHGNTQLLSNHLQQKIISLEFIVDDTNHGQHIGLLAQFITLVHLTVEVDSQVRNQEQGLLYLETTHLRLQRISTAQKHTTSKRERTVKPCIENRTTIYLGIEFYHPTLGVHLCCGLHTEAGRIAMRTDEFKTSLGRMCRTHAEGKHCRVILSHEIPFTGHQHRERLTCIEVSETCSFELLLYILGSQEIDGRCIEQVHQLLCDVVHIKIFYVFLHC